MPDTKRQDPRQQLVEVLMQKVADDQYPSYTMLDMLEELMEPEEIPAYVELLLERVRDERFPSIPILKRIRDLT